MVLQVKKRIERCWSSIYYNARVLSSWWCLFTHIVVNQMMLSSVVDLSACKDRNIGGIKGLSVKSNSSLFDVENLVGEKHWGV